MLVTERGANLKSRIFFDRIVVPSEKYQQSLEDYFLENREVPTMVYLEVALPNGQWPTDAAQHKAVACKLLTNGLNNLGNSIIVSNLIACYMNASLQCLVNTKFVKEYMMGETNPRWYQHVNLGNRLGRHGELIKAFSDLVSNLL